MLTSIVLGYLAGRMGEPVAEVDSVVVPVEQADVLSIACEFFLWSLIVLTAAALIWMLAPGVIALIRFVSPDLAAYLNFTLEPDCTAARQDWYFVKRAIVGYAGLVAALSIASLTWHLVRRHRSPKSKVMRRWMIVADDEER